MIITAKRTQSGKEFRTVDVYIDTYNELIRYSKANRYGVKGLVNRVLAEWLANHPLKEPSIIDKINQHDD